jgi:hypothetical protein
VSAGLNGAPGPDDVTRLAAALAAVEQDAHAMLAKLEVAEPLLSEATLDALREKAHDVRRHVAKALGSEQAHRGELLLREQREDMMRRRIVEVVAERDAVRLVAAGLAGVPPKRLEAFGPEAWDGAANFAMGSLGLSSAEWQVKVDALKPAPSEAPWAPEPAQVAPKRKPAARKAPAKSKARLTLKKGGKK